MKNTLLAMLGMLSGSLLFAQSTLVRGPYLNLGTPGSTVVKWRTTSAEVGVLKYGTSPTSLTELLTEDSAVVNHELNVTGLQPSTKYYYSIGTGSTFYTTADTSFFFKTSPTPGTAPDTRIWVIGDFGNGSQATINVKNGFMNNYRDKHTDLWLWTGDNAYGDGTDAEYQDKVFQVYPEMFRNTTVWPCPGNHDYGSVDLAGNGPYFDIFTLPKAAEAGGIPSTTEAYYSFDYGDIHCISINSEYLQGIYTTNTPFTQWLRQDLQNNTKKWVIAYWHQPPYTKGTHDSDDNFSRSELTRKNVNPILEEFGCDLVLNGHSHGYERSYLIKGHFGKASTFDHAGMLLNGTNGKLTEVTPYTKYTDGPSRNHGTVYAVVGCSGQKGSGNSPLNHPVMYMSTEDYHGSMVIDIMGNNLHAKFIDTMGTVLDEFNIVKESSTSIGQPLKYNNGIFLEAYPNPFKESFTISFTLQKTEKVRIEIKDTEGKTIEAIDDRTYAAGTYKISYEPTKKVSQGIYFIEVRTANKLAAKRLVRME
jgi:hypothetical protein